MEPIRHVMRPLWSPAVAIVTGILAFASAWLLLDRGSYVATVHVERHDPPIEQPARETTFLGQTRYVPAWRVHATYSIVAGRLSSSTPQRGDLQQEYAHAALDVHDRGEGSLSCDIVLRNPRSDASPVVLGVTFLDLFEGHAEEERRLWFSECDRSTEPEHAKLANHLDAWLASGAHGTFDDRVGSRSGNLGVAFVPLSAFGVVLAVMLLFHVRIEADPSSVRVVRSFLGFERVVANVHAAEIKGVRVAATKLGPLTLHRPTLALSNHRAVALWPVPRPAMNRALEAREALLAQIVEWPREERGLPFRGEI